ncbi:MAG: hypothetical protein FD143_3476 [Ignavibacteria bacterium]|nr:MAG: hypothetical protein FD143_3476 [Ignavibacteria bacterium]KAF0150799.1 MAG: hypothetical protein FD188_3479 [Ignavibacteria bacterium]
MSILSKANARKLIDKYCFSKPEEVNLLNLIYAENLVLKEEELDGCEGKIIFDSNMGIVTINKKIKEQTQKNFVLAHELGHYINEKLEATNYKLNRNRVLNLESEMEKINSPQEKNEEQAQHTVIQSGCKVKVSGFYRCSFEDFYGNNKILETDANDFAAELLMPEEWMLKAVRGKMLNGRLISDTAKYFNVSLTAAAIRYSEVGHRECAVVFSTNGTVKWSSINKEFKYQFIRPQRKASTLSYTSDFFNGNTLPNTEEEIPAEAWFNECFNIDKRDKVFEYNVPMPRYNSVLSLIWMK